MPESPQPPDSKQPRSIFSKWRFSNSALSICILISVFVHLILLFLLGGLIVWRNFYPLEPSLEAVGIVEEQTKKKNEVQIKKVQQVDEPVQKRVTVDVPSNLKMPAVDLEAPEVSPQVDLSRGMEKTMGVGTEIGKSLKNISRDLEFLDVKSQGERIVIVMDDSGSMHSWGLEAIKKEVIKLADRLPDGTLMNVILFNHGSGPRNGMLGGGRLSPIFRKLVPVKESVRKTLKKRLLASSMWPPNQFIEDLNAGPLPPVNIVGWWAALHLAFEQGADTIYLLVDHWDTDINMAGIANGAVIEHVAAIIEKIYQERSYRPTINILLFMHGLQADRHVDNFRRIADQNRGTVSLKPPLR